MRYWRIIQVLLLAATTISALSTPLGKASATSPQIILIRINSAIDYKTADLIANAADAVQRGDAAKLLLELDTDSAYYAPSMQLVDQLSSIRTKVIAYVGPAGAVSSTFSAFVAMASGLLVMNTGTSIGNAAAGVGDPDTVNYLTVLMRSLAVMNGRNALAAAEMVAGNVEYSADDAYLKGVCDLEVDSYGALLSTLNLNPANIVEVKPSQYPSVNSDTGYALVKFFADPFLMKSLFVGCAVLVMLNLLIAVARPRRSKLDETNQTILELVRMELLSLDLRLSAGESHLNDTPLHTIANTPSPATFKMSRVPTPFPNKRLERQIEVRKS
jgi:membrane-bound ClpP family serine protease